jgi:hypothetical protein
MDLLAQQCENGSERAWPQGNYDRRIDRQAPSSMPRRLSFIVFGVPRSGTKGLMRALNLHPNVLCAQERFDDRVDHSQVTFPGSFLDGPKVMNRLQRKKLQQLRATAAQKTDIRFVGNKFPRYYLALDRINGEVSNLRNLLIYRSPYGFMPSWNRKELDHRRSSWQVGQVGLFGFFELLICLQNAVRQPRTFVFPYSAGLNKSPEPILAALTFIGADPTSFDLSTFVAKHIPERITSPRRVPIMAHEQAFLDKLQAKELDELVTRHWGVITPTFRAQVADYITTITPALPGAIDEAAAEYENPALTYYGASYVQANSAGLAELLELTEGSSFMATLQETGLWRRAKGAFVQRSSLRRRFTSLRITDPRGLGD